MLFDKIVSVEKRVLTGAIYGYVPVVGLEAIPINIQPIQAEFGTNQGMTFKNYRAFVTNSGIVEGMRLTVSGTNEQFIVRGRQRYDDILSPHYELVVEADKQ